MSLRRPPSVYFEADRLTTASSATLEGGFGTAATTPGEETPTTPSKGGRRQKWTHVLKDLPKTTFSRPGTPTMSTPGSTFTEADEWISKKDWEKIQEKKERKRRRKKAEIFVRRRLTSIEWEWILMRTIADHPPRCGDHPASRVRVQAYTGDDDVWWAEPPAAGADPGDSARA